MDTARWQRLSPLLDELFDLPLEARTQRLAELRAGDPELAGELEALIALEEGQEHFLSEPVLPPVGRLRPGGEVGPYRLEGLLGEGGMGQVWLAARADGLYQRRVALKLLRPGLVESNLRLRFNRERQILARLAHPHIARLLDAGLSSDGLPYLALEYVDGIPITDFCRQHRISLEDRLRMFQQVCDAVSHAHANLIVHRDLKPSNILVSAAGEVHLLDFGIAKLLDHDSAPEQTRTGVRAFTLHYAAPEQILGEPITTMTDVYTLGVVLYELLTDNRPYQLKRKSDAEWEQAILDCEPVRPSQSVLRGSETTVQTEDSAGVDVHDAANRQRRARALAGDLDKIVLKALSKRAEHRYPSVEALSQDLLRYHDGRPVHARPMSVGYRLHKYVVRHRWSLASALLMTTVLTIAFAMVAWQARQAVREASRAQAMQDFIVGVFENAGGGSEGQALDLRALLDTSVERGDDELILQPRARADLLGLVARLRIGLGDYQHARDLLEQQAAIIEEVAKKSPDAIPPSLRLESLTQRGRVLRLLNHPEACITVMEPGLAEARREQAQLPPQASAFFSQLGRCRAATGGNRTARQLFERALVLRRDSGDRAGQIENLLDLAGLLSDSGNTAAAMDALAAARRQLRREVGERHPLMVEIQRSVADLHRVRGDLDQAEREIRAASAGARELHGNQHPVLLAIRRQLAGIRADQGRMTEALTELRQVHVVLERRLPAKHPELSESLMQIGTVEWQLGEFEAARQSLQRAVEMRRGGNDPAATADALFQLASVLHEQGHPEEAQPLLIEARQLRRAHFGPQHPSIGDTDRLLGEVKVALGDVKNGTELLGYAVLRTHRGYGPDHPRTHRAQLSHAIQLSRGDTDHVHSLDPIKALDALAELPQTDPALREIAWRAQAHAARLRCSGPQRMQALGALRALGMRLQQARPEGGVVVREVLDIQRGCQMPPGDTLAAWLD
ncbi:MAG: serine/threonine-protein kinase [Pseudomonadota bacterium]|nr:serine/threonine-protein kinase [Pseudomonadota bacterium]